MKARRDWGKPDDRLCNPLPAIQSPPGGGKSFFLDQLARLDHDDIDCLCEDADMRKIMKSSVAVTVSYKGNTPVSEVDDGHPVVCGFGLRVLSRYINISPLLRFVVQSLESDLTINITSFPLYLATISTNKTSKNSEPCWERITFTI